MATIVYIDDDTFNIEYERTEAKQPNCKPYYVARLTVSPSYKPNRVIHTRAGKFGDERQKLQPHSLMCVRCNSIDING